MVHGKLRIGSIYTTLSGEWKLGGFETLGSLKEDQNVFVNYANRVPNLGRYLSPGMSLSSYRDQKRLHAVLSEVIRGQARTVMPSAVDGYAFGCLIHEVFNGAFSRAEDLGQRGSIPTVGCTFL